MSDVERFAEDFDPAQLSSSRRPTGQEMFDALTPEQQDAEFGHEIAQLLRDGKIILEDLVSRSRMATAEDFITAASAEEALANAARRHH